MLNYWRLYKLYKTKINTFVADIEYNTYFNLSSNDIKRFEIHIPLTNGETARYLFIGANTFKDNRALGAKFDFIGYVNVKQIRHCTLKEFLQYYNKSLLTTTHKKLGVE